MELERTTSNFLQIKLSLGLTDLVIRDWSRM